MGWNPGQGCSHRLIVSGQIPPKLPWDASWNWDDEEEVYPFWDRDRESVRGFYLCSHGFITARVLCLVYLVFLFMVSGKSAINLLPIYLWRELDWWLIAMTISSAEKSSSCEVCLIQHTVDTDFFKCWMDRHLKHISLKIWANKTKKRNVLKSF